MDALSNPDCLFCKISAGQMRADFVYEDDKVVAFVDIAPASPIHYVITPRNHFESIMDVPLDLISHVHEVIKNIATREGFSEYGFRVVNNCGRDGGQFVNHVHWHLLAGRHHSWPPG
jgi:histidine triad (HIT) family protein